MTNANSNTSTSTVPQWGRETSDYFTIRLDGAQSILEALAINVEDFRQVGAGRASDEAIALSVEHVASEILKLEKLTYEFDMPTADTLGELSLKLMRARALTEVISGMFGADGWKINIGDESLVEYFNSIYRLLREAYHEAVAAHARRFPSADQETVQA